ncbi:MAG: Asp-tRNA(Asn)/Glu-tRNA(Gln) amidotransferase subunit GatB [Ruminococcaceae bacterium]|nr:Asp-tRNA(Asn)/Glu-tRNA(Gln) amidotransferase subunit GatB [Oscillospiraceae bacterium]
MRYETVIGLEVHVELATKSKIFCACSTAFGAAPNTQICPVCTGMPGGIPQLNKGAVTLSMKAGMLLHCEIAGLCGFDKKNYFYPDLPSAYQRTQWYAPIAKNGYVEIETASGKKRVRIKQIHMEEDAGKLIHDEAAGVSLVDYNRAGVPLVEIVSEPDLSSPEEVAAYLNRLRTLLRFAEVSDCRMEQGSMRCDVNLSVRPAGAEALGVRTEIKNMNSISAILRAIEYESARHVEVLEAGEELLQETRRWDEMRGVSVAMRDKQTAADYRYFPDPDVMPLAVDAAWKQKVRESLPELPEQKKARYVRELGLSDYDAGLLCDSHALCRCFEAALAVCQNAKECANWLLSDVLAILKRRQMIADELTLDGHSLGELILLVLAGKVGRANARKILEEMFERELDPAAYAAKMGFLISRDTDKIGEVIRAVLAENAHALADYLGGKEKAFAALFGACMKQLRGNCDPQMLREMLLEEIRK